MYTLSSKLKITSIILMLIGLIGLAYSFISVPSDIAEAKEIINAQAGHHNGHSPAAVTSGTDSNSNANASEQTGHEAENHEINLIDKAQGKPGFTEGLEKYPYKNLEEHHGKEHWEHVLHQLQTRPWSATFVAAFFFFMIALGALVFYAIQYASQAGWSPVLYRVMEGITSYLIPGSIIVFLIVIFAGTHFYIWQDETVVATDEILQVKSAYLNVPFFIIRIIIYLAGYNLYQYFSRKNSLRQAEVTAGDYAPYRKNFKISVYFLVFFAVTETLMAWDFFMSMTPHWFSTLFAWYVFASIFVTGITSIALVVIFLKRTGYLSFVNDSHLHDLAKYIFAFSIFWTYLWFAQFMLIWYANLPEEVTYFIIRIQEYNLLFFGMLVLNFVFPVLMLMNSDYKRIPWFVIMTGVVVLVGHYIDIFLLVMPPTVGPNWFFGIPEIAAICFFLGLFILIVCSSLAKVPLHPKGDPFIKESENYHY